LESNEKLRDLFRRPGVAGGGGAFKIWVGKSFPEHLVVKSRNRWR